MLESRVRQDRFTGESVDHSVSPPKFSTTVENTVEIKVLPRNCDEMTSFVGVSYQGEGYEEWISRCLACGSSPLFWKTR